MQNDVPHPDQTMSAEEVASRFEALQKKLEQMWRFIGWDDLGGAAQEANINKAPVAIPTVHPTDANKCALINADLLQ